MKKKLKLKRPNFKYPNDLTDVKSKIKDMEDVPIRQIEELEDGSTVYEVGDKSSTEPVESNFNDNLAINMSEDTLKKISTYITDCLEEDIEARQPWLDIHNKAKKYLGYNLEDTENLPFSQACRLFDTTLNTATIRACATASAEMLPETGPCSYKVVGKSDEDLLDIGKVRSQWLNYFLTTKDIGYYKDFEKSLYYTGFYGTIIRKVYFDSLLNRPMSRFIAPENFLVNIDCTSILDSDRLTHILKLSARDVLINQKKGIYREVELPYLTAEGQSDGGDDSDVDENDDLDNIVNIENYSKRTLHDVYESHIYLNLESFEEDYDKTKIMDIAKPYIVTIDKDSKEIFSIKRNWDEGDKEQTRRKYFVAYQYFTGFDIWGLGLARIAGTNAIAVTNMLRQTVDAATYQNLPAGFIQKGTTKQQITNLTLGPGDYKNVDVTGNIRDLFATLPANGPSPALMELRQEIIGQMQDQLSTAELGMMDSKEDIAVGTAGAFLEEKGKIQSAVLKSLHKSFSEELQLLDNIFKESLEREEFYIGSEKHIITKEHFIDSIKVIPVSDPSVNSNVQRILKAEAVMQTAMQMPEEVNPRELLKMVFKAQGLNNDVIETIMSTNEADVLPQDPISENMNMMQNKPVKAAIEQNHDAHIKIHSVLDTDQSRAHIQEHEALKFLVQMQQAMGIDLSTIDLDDPEIQNMVAIKASEAVDHLGLNNNPEENQEMSFENKLIADDIEQKREANIIRKEIADKKLEADIFKTQLKFEGDKDKLRFEKEQALLDARLEMEKLKSQGFK